MTSGRLRGFQFAGAGGTGSSSLSGLTDVALTSPADNSVLSYDEASEKWVDTELEIAAALDDLTDVNTGTVYEGQVLTKSGTEWVATTIVASPALDDLSDVTISSPYENQLLKYNGSAWVNATVATGGGGALDDLTDVAISTPALNQAIVFNGTTWTNTTVTWTDPVTQYISTTGTAATIDWANGEYVILNATSASGNITLTLSNPKQPYTYIVQVLQGNPARNITFPTGTLQGGGTTGNVVIGVVSASQFISVIYNNKYFVSTDTYG